MSSDGPDRSEFDALEFDRYSQIHLISRDLNETGNDVLTAAGKLQNLRGDFDSFLRRTSNLVSDVQDKLTRIRMVPLEASAARLQRTVRVTASLSAKQVDFSLEGGSTELDQTVLAKLAGPLEHLLRNAGSRVEDPPRAPPRANRRAAEFRCALPRKVPTWRFAWPTTVAAWTTAAAPGGGAARLPLRRGSGGGEPRTTAYVRVRIRLLHCQRNRRDSGGGVGLDVVKAAVESLAAR